MKPPFAFSVIVIGLFAIIVLAPILYMLFAPLFFGKMGVPGGVSSLLEERHLVLAKNSLILAGGTTAFSLLIGVPLAFLLEKTDVWAGRLFRVMYIIPVLIPPYIHAIVWTHMSPLLQRLVGLDIHSLWGAIWVLTLAYYPFVTLMTMGGLKSIDRNLEETALLCHGKGRTIAKITLPLVTPHILSGAIFVFIFALIDFGVPDILRVRVYPVEIFIQFSAFFDEAAATVLSLPLLGIAGSLLLVQRWIMKDRAYVQIASGFGQPVRYCLGRMRPLAFLGCLAIVIPSAALPVAALIRVAGPLANYGRALSSSMSTIGFSLALALAGASLTLFLSFFLSYLIERSKMRTKTLLEFLSFLPLATPAITLGIGLIRVWNRPMAEIVYGSSLIVIFGYVAHFIPFCTASLTSGFKQLNPHLEETASLHCGAWFKIMHKIVVPLLRPSLISGFFIVFVLSLGDLGTTLLVIPPGQETIPNRIYNLMHYGAEQLVAALCLFLIAIILGLSGLMFFCYQKSIRSVQA